MPTEPSEFERNRKKSDGIVRIKTKTSENHSRTRLEGYLEGNFVRRKDLRYIPM